MNVGRVDAGDSPIILDGIRQVLSKAKAPGVLRLVFHDAGTYDMNENSVSWADMIAMAGAEAVLLCGGPVIPVQLGRLDSMVPDPEGRLPLESLNASSLKKSFLKKGFSTQELVALSGAHTLGSKGFGNPTVFDNSYFKVLVEKPWSSSAGMSSMIGLPSDRALVEDDECLRWIRIYADDQMKFFKDFKNAYLKLVNTGAQWKSA
ncbi:putative L-ascorbate peroxidase 6 isoform X2 [Cinnamomum micranthum f. kanehirae]|uniref:Putative L-ascorbate peroxidase 6 isoform X2 n=1 Tax=Cinnamomum micranthum f. kanehirae TaxID=337451 RepID=A0A443N1M2_9MAGN|nr:putative L-ascorbate peroxidase 6 isoform X2 [Cinnamomum micranthum f. kanehirae]